MSYTIENIEYHKNSLKQIAEQTQRRIDEQTDLMDCALSSWGDSTMQRFHNVAISLLESGIEETGKEIPYSKFLTLVDTDNNVVATKLGHNEFYGKSSSYWILNDEMETKYGRKFIPSSSRSRIQKKLGLQEVRIMKEAKSYLSSSCAGRGCPVSFRAVAA